jgi:hypothetical protein
MDTEETLTLNRGSPSRRKKRRSRLWRIFGKRLPRGETVFFTQMFLIFIVVAVALYNLTKGCGEDKFWIGLLCSVIGYCLPNPKIKINR